MTHRFLLCLVAAAVFCPSSVMAASNPASRLEARYGDASEICSVTPLLGRGDSITIRLTYDDGSRAVFKPDHEKWFPDRQGWSYRCRPWRAEVASYALGKVWGPAAGLRFPVTVRLEVPAQLLRQLVEDDPVTKVDEVAAMEAILAGTPGHPRPLFLPGTEDLVGSVQEWMSGGTKRDPLDGRRAERPIMEDLVSRLETLHGEGTHGTLWRQFANLVTFDFLVGNNDRACNFLFDLPGRRIMPIDNDSAFSVSWGGSWNRTVFEALPLVDDTFLRRVSSWLEGHDDAALRREVFWPWPVDEGLLLVRRLREIHGQAMRISRGKGRFEDGDEAGPRASLP